MNQAEIEAVWAEFSVQPTGADMTNECRLAAGIIALRAEVSRKANAEAFYKAWWFLAEHPKFNHLKDGVPDLLPGFMDNLDVDVVRVDPVTLEHSDQPGAVTRFWLEAGPWDTIPPECFEEGHIPGTYDEVRTHDPKLDCGGATYEEAIIKMAALVLEHYGDYVEERDEAPPGEEVREGRGSQTLPGGAGQGVEAALSPPQGVQALLEAQPGASGASSSGGGAQAHPGGGNGGLGAPRPLDVESTVVIGQGSFAEKRNTLVIGWGEPHVQVTIHADGRVELPPGWKPDDAASEFWETLQQVVNMETIGFRHEIKQLREFIRDCAKNWDCDNDGHRYNTGCRTCQAQTLLDGSESRGKT